MMPVNRYQREAAFLRNRPAKEVKPLGAGIVTFSVAFRENGDSDVVLRKTKSVLSVIDEAGMSERWPDEEVLIDRLPHWFTAACSPPMSELQANSWLIKWKKMTTAERAVAEDNQRWSIDNWLHWMRPEHRQWYWWDAQAGDEGDLLLAVEVEGWPFPWGSLRWLFKAAGAHSISSVE